jgi:hypothetical protein
VHRQLFVVGKLTDITSIDFGMEVNQLVLTGSWSNITFSKVVLENLGPGDKRSAVAAGNHNVQAGYNIWPVLFDRCVRQQARPHTEACCRRCFANSCMLSCGQQGSPHSR